MMKHTRGPEATGFSVMPVADSAVRKTATLDSECHTHGTDVRINRRCAPALILPSDGPLRERAGGGA